MRGLIVFCIATVAVAAPQGLVHPPIDHQLSIENSSSEGYMYSQLPETGSNTIDEIPDFTESELSSILEQSQNFTSQSLPNEEKPVVELQAPYGSESKDQHQQVVVTKNFFIHSAPEEGDEEVLEKVLNIGQPRKNYNVVFIRAPVPPRSRSGIKIIPAVNEEKTIVYVLSKKAEADDIQTHIEELPSTTTKPEVHFIKYKTDEEAKHAQEKIQAEYQHLGGSTEVSDEGISSVSSVIGSLGTSNQEELTHIAPSYGPPKEDVSNEELVALLPNNGYLPPSYY